MYLKVCALSMALGVFGLGLPDKDQEAAAGCGESAPLCPTVHAVATGAGILYAAMMAR